MRTQCGRRCFATLSGAGIADISERAAILEAGRALADGPCGTALYHDGLQSGQAVLMGQGQQGRYCATNPDKRSSAGAMRDI
jgi:hypothetical protein